MSSARRALRDECHRVAVRFQPIAHRWADNLELARATLGVAWAGRTMSRQGV
jgi:hypothetical protein